MTHKEAMSRSKELDEALKAADAESAAAKASVNAAVDAITNQPGGDPEAVHAKRLQLENDLARAKSRALRADLGQRQAARALKEALEQEGRIAENAATFEKLDKSTDAVASKEQAILKLAAEMQTKLGAEIADLHKLIDAANGIWSTLPADTRALDTNLPAHSAMQLAHLTPATPDLLARVGVAVARNLALGALDSSATAKSKAVNPWAGAKA